MMLPNPIIHLTPMIFIDVTTRMNSMTKYAFDPVGGIIVSVLLQTERSFVMWLSFMSFND